MIETVPGVDILSWGEDLLSSSGLSVQEAFEVQELLGHDLTL